uniref:Zgc:162941 n=1 Tax=Cyprinus carpio TaxID=7962 RepID=A0A8C2J8W0_CYPCA
LASIYGDIVKIDITGASEVTAKQDKLTIKDFFVSFANICNVHHEKHTPVGAWDSEQHVAQATEILIGFIKEIKVKFPKWTQEQCFKGGIAAYNKSVSRVSTSENIDARTTGQDYSNDGEFSKYDHFNVM